MGTKKNKKPDKQSDQILALHIAGRQDQFERNGGGQWVSVNRPHKNKKKYDRNNFKRENRKNLPYFLYLLIKIQNMADINILAPFILSCEGGYCNDPHDKGGATKYGVTLNTWKAHGYDKNGDGVLNKEDIKLLTESDAVNRILKPLFWDKCKADQINDQSVANIIVDWAYNSGFSAIKKVQTILGITSDGIVGEKTLKAINSQNPEEFFNKIHQAREKHYKSLSNFSRYGKGWMNRLNRIKYGSLEY